jgi:hypothetical protein
VDSEKGVTLEARGPDKVGIINPLTGDVIAVIIPGEGQRIDFIRGEGLEPDQYIVVDEERK